MKIIVTGGAGFIGRSVCRHLREEGHEVATVDIRPDGPDAPIVDVLDLDQLRGAFRGADVVYHLAGPVLETTRQRPFESAQVQFTGTLNVLEACRMEDVPKVVLASSFYVYDGLRPEEIVNEYSPLDPASMELFGSLKLMAEQLVLAYAKKFGLEYVILRFGSAYGLGKGASNLIQTFLDAGLRGEVLEVWGSGKRINQYTYVEDIAAGCVAALRASNEIFNLISPEETSTGELATILSERFGFDVRFLTDKPEGASVPYMSPRKAIRQLEFEATPFLEALDEMVGTLRAVAVA
jgi:UDP-glucose 4-epimerase